MERGFENTRKEASPDIRTQYDVIGDAYVSGQKEYFGGKPDRGRELIGELLGDLKGRSVVDMGCGGGSDILAYHEKGAEHIVGVDPSQKMLDMARGSVGEKADLKKGDFEHIPANDASADVVAARFSFHYLESFDQAYAEVARVLKPEGVFVFLVPHPDDDMRRRKMKDSSTREVIEVSLYDGKVIVRYPSHTMEDYLSDTFQKLFELERMEQIMPEEMDSKDAAPTALAIRAKKK